MRRQKSDRARYGDEIRREVFPPGVTSAYIAEISGINASTIRSWRSDPCKMPAWRYKKIMEALTRERGMET